jgi:hypothetical protein
MEKKTIKQYFSRLFYKLFGKLRVTSYLNDFENSFKNPVKYYNYCNYYLIHFARTEIKQHRQYFMQEGRSFGESPFTVMWMLLFKNYPFNNFLEIGIYRGQVISLIALLAKLNNKQTEVFGISPLTNANDSVTEYAVIDYEKDIKNHFDFFDLKMATILKEYSNSETAISFIKSKTWGCIYIDGSHDYEIVKSDFEVCYEALQKGGLLIFDDSSSNLNKSDFYGEFAGHPGPSEVVDKIVSAKMKEILRVGHNRCFVKA